MISVSRALRIAFLLSLICGLAILFIYAALLAEPYGDATTLNAGFTLGCIGFETRGDPGFFNACDFASQNHQE